MEQSQDKFKDSFEKSPIGILFFDKEGKLTDANQSALKIGGIPSLNDVMGFNVFDDPNVASIKDKLLEKGSIKIQAPFNFDYFKKLGVYNPTRSGTAVIDLIISVIESGFLVQIQDITEIKHIGEELRESEENFRVIADESPVSITVYRNNRHLYVNPATESLLGYTKEELLEMNFMDFIHPDYRNMIKELACARMEGDQKQKRFESKIITKDGKEKWTETSSSIINYKGAPAGIVTSIDISERKKAEEDLKLKNEQLRLSLESANAGMWIRDPVGEWKATPELNTLFGRSIDDPPLLEDEFIDYIHPEDLQRLIIDWNAAKKGDYDYDQEYRVIWPDGSIHWLSSKGKMFLEYDKPRFIGITFDVTKPKKIEEDLRKLSKNLENTVKKRTLELKNAYESLKESEEKFRLIFDEADDSIVLNEMMENGLPGKIIEANEATTKRLGYTKEELLNMTPVDIVTPECRAEMPKNAEEIRKKGFAIFESIHVTKDGRKIPVEVNNHIIKFKGKQTALTVVRDITNRKKMQKTLKETIDELKRSNQELQQFAYITSHDLQEPLRTMGSYAGLLKRRYKGQLNSDADEFINYMVDGATRMQDMIKGLLEYSRVGTKGGELRYFSSENALNNALTNLKSLIYECNAEVSHGPLPIIYADESQITRIFQNLIGNALKFHKEGVKPKINIKARKEDKKYVFSVSDNGIGLEEQYTDKIFELFKRLHAIGEYGGAGIGLAIVKRIVDRHGGRIWVESKFGEGSTFYFTLPFDENEVIEFKE